MNPKPAGTRSKSRPQRRKKKWKPIKVVNDFLTPEFCARRAAIAQRQGYEVPKYISFARILLAEGFRLQMYEAQRTVSKYLTVSVEGFRKTYKVRFSNHKPIRQREIAGDCDFFVGRTHLGVTTTAMALRAVREYFHDTEAERRARTELVDTTPEGSIIPSPNSDRSSSSDADLPWY